MFGGVLVRTCGLYRYPISGMEPHRRDHRSGGATSMDEVILQTQPEEHGRGNV